MSRQKLRNRLAKVEAASVPPAPGALAPPRPGDDSGVLAAEAAAAFGAMVKLSRVHYKLTAAEAEARAAEAPPHYLDRALTCPPDQLSWLDLDALARHDPARAL